MGVRIPILVLTVLLLSGCAGAGGAGGTSGGTQSNQPANTPLKYDPHTTMGIIQARNKLVVGVPLSLAPFAYTDPNTGSIAGFDIDVAKLVAQGLFGADIEGKIDYVDIDPLQRENELADGRIDIAMGRYAITLSRKRFVDFAGPYFVAHQSIVVSSNSDIQSLFDLNGQKVCTVRGSTDTDALSAAVPGADISLVETSVQACGADLVAGKAVAVAADHVDLLPLTATASAKLQKLTATYGTTPYGIGVKKADTTFRTFLNDRLDPTSKIGIKSQDLQSAFTRTIADTAPTPPPLDRY